MIDSSIELSLTTEHKSFIENLTRMIEILGLSERPMLMVASLPDSSVEITISEFVRKNLGTTYRCLEFTYQSNRLSPLTSLSSPQKPTKYSIILSLGISKLPEESLGKAFSLLNRERDGYRGKNLSLILFVESKHVGFLISKAPDFWSCVTELLEFPPTANGYSTALASLQIAASSGQISRLKDEYLNWLLEVYEWIDFRGILQLRNIVRLKLDEIYIPLKLLLEAGMADEPIRQLTLFPQEDSPDLEISQTLTGRGKRLKIRATIPEILKNINHVVILGDPGSGKSTLLKGLAIAIAKKSSQVKHLHSALPILLPLAAYAESLKDNKGQTLIDFIPLYFMQRGLPDLALLISHEIKERKCLFLLDGLDEVVSAKDRRAISQKIYELLVDFPEQKYVITSRIAGYRSTPLKGDFLSFKLLPFQRKEIEQFVRKWCLAYESVGGETQETKKRARIVARGLLEAIWSHPGIERLATNPLLITIIALIYYYGTRLPQRRADLYRLCVEALAETWNRARSLSERPIELWLGERRLDERLVINILSPVAFEMQQTRSRQEPIPRSELKQKILQQLMEKEGLTNAKAEDAASGFIDLIKEQSGLLVERGQDLFSFTHLTFQEYLAARYLASRQNPLELSRKQLHHHHWREVVLLTSAILEGDHAASFLEGILRSNSLYNEIIHRDELLAGWCMADGADAPYSLKKEIICRLIELWSGIPFPSLTTEIDQALHGFIKTPFQDFLFEKLAGILTHGLARAKFFAYHLLSSIASHHHQQAKNLLHNLLNSSSRDEQKMAAFALAGAEIYSQELINHLLEGLEDTRPSIHAFSSFYLAKSLSQSKVDKDTFRKVFLSLAKTKVNWEAPSYFPLFWDEVLNVAISHPEMISETLESGEPAFCLEIIKHLPNKLLNEEKIQEILAKNLDSCDLKIRLASAAALIKLESFREKCLPILLDGISNGEKGIKILALSGLKQVARRVPDAYQAILRLASDQERAIRRDVYRWLTLQQPWEKENQTLIGFLDDPDPFILIDLAWNIQRLKPPLRKPFEDGFYKRLEDNDSKIRGAAAYALMLWGHISEDILIEFLHSPLDYLPEIYLSTGKIKPIIPILVDHICKGSDLERKKAIYLVNVLEIDSKELIGPLLNNLGHEDPEIIAYAALALENLASPSEEVIQQLIQALNNPKNNESVNIPLIRFHLIRGQYRFKPFLPGLNVYDPGGIPVSDILWNTLKTLVSRTEAL